MTVKVLIDTSILCEALYSGADTSLARAVLHDALLGPDLAFQPIFSETILLEFISRCRKGIGDKSFTESRISQFLDAFTPLWDSENRVRIRAGRVFDSHSYKRPLVQILLDGLQNMPEGESARIRNALATYNLHLNEVASAGDWHVLISAVMHDVDIIVTYNVKDFPSGGSLLIWHPQLLRHHVREGTLKEALVERCIPET